MEATMKRQTLISGLLAGAALILLSGCAYDDYDRGGYYSGGGFFASFSAAQSIAACSISVPTRTWVPVERA